jgi:trans-2,3-dihydro-3-hydroxyanthranilate isomerase
LPRFEYRLVDVFTTERFGGNPLAVFPDGRGIDPVLMQRFAFELNLSETTFVLPTERADCDVRVRIFAPRREVPMAGHPTIGTAFVLDRGNRIVFEEGVGPVPVERVRGADGAMQWRMSQPRPRFAACADDPARVAAALGLEVEDLDGDLPLEVVATGLPFLLVPLRSLAALARVRVRMDAWEALAAARDGATMPYLFTRTTLTGADAPLRARMLAPMYGIAEDPATGSAAGPLGAYALAGGLIRPDREGIARLVVHQGVEYGRPSQLWVEVEGAGRNVTAVRVAGACVATGGGWFDA